MNKALKMMVLLAVLGVSYVYAQTGRTLVADIPFAFHVGDKLMPAGEYTVASSIATGAVLLRSADFKARIFAVTFACEKPQTPDQGRLGFRRYGSSYFLARIWTAGYAQGRELPPSRAERESAQAGILTLASVPARTR